MHVCSDHFKLKAITFEKAFVRTHEIVYTSLFSQLHAIISYWFHVSIYTTCKKTASVLSTLTWLIPWLGVVALLKIRGTAIPLSPA